MAVCSAVCRAFGTILVEVPLVATRTAARRRGHARVLMSALERFFSQVRSGVAARSLFAQDTDQGLSTVFARCAIVERKLLGWLFHMRTPANEIG